MPKGFTVCEKCKKRVPSHYKKKHNRLKHKKSIHKKDLLKKVVLFPVLTLIWMVGWTLTFFCEPKGTAENEGN